MNPLFPVLPEELASLSDDELQALIDEHVSAIELIRANDTAFLEGRSGSEVIEALRAGVEQMRVLRAEADGRASQEESYTGTVEDLVSEGLSLAASGTEDDTAGDGGDDAGDGGGDGGDAADDAAGDGEDDGEDDAEGDETGGEAGEASTDAVTAGGPPATPLYRRPPTPAPDRRGQNQTAGAVLRASAGLENVVAPGQVLDQATLREALITANEITTAKPGEQAKVVVATARFPYPPERRLDNRNAALNAEVIKPAQNMVATGGFCAPFPSFYDLPVISVADRPVRDALVSFQAGRGGVAVPTNISMATIEDGVGIVTAEQDEEGGSPAVKNCVSLECDPWTDYNVDAVYACVTHGVLNARAWPERVDAVAELLAAQHAKVAETNLLDQISLGSTATTDEKKYGAVSTLLQGVIKAAAAYRSRHRMRADSRLTAMFPAWVVDLMLVDMIHGQFDRFHPRDYIESILSRAGINVSYYLDENTGSNQVYGAQAAGALNEFLTTVVWYLFDSGHWLFLDFGELNLGIIRDFDLATTNDFAIFRETFEGAAPVGIESLEVTSTVCPDGTYAPAGSAITC